VPKTQIFVLLMFACNREAN